MISLKYLYEGWVTKNHALAKVSDYAEAFHTWAEATSDDALDVAGMYEDDYDDKKAAKEWRAFSKDMMKVAMKMRKVWGKFKNRKQGSESDSGIWLVPTDLHKKLEAAKFHQEQTTADNYKFILKQAQSFAKQMEALK
tara:strand:- start:260 stop:673 length:414 start_codon:yes stop_codon:yes gene_type:complete